MSKKIIFSSFYCISCGKKVLDLPRNKGHLYKSFHRKKLFCPWCSQEINTVECKNESDVWNFKEKYNNGEYNKEALESIYHCAGQNFSK